MPLKNEINLSKYFFIIYNLKNYFFEKQKVPGYH